MPRKGNLNEPRKSRKFGQKFEKDPAPIREQAERKGMITCQTCGAINEVSAYTPDGWFTGYCKGKLGGEMSSTVCGSLLTGFILET